MINEELAIIFLTFNEEQDITAAMEAAQDLGRLWLVDSGSTDRTVELAKTFDAKILQRDFDGFGSQRNWAIDQMPPEITWILFLDADEIATDSFKQSVREAISNTPSETAGYYCCWKTILRNRWLKYSDSFPKWQFRLLRKGRARFINSGHGQKEGEIEGQLSYLQEPYLHYVFSKGWSHWFSKHNTYSTKEAKERFSNAQPFSNCLSRTPSIRNTALKYWLTKIPGWPLLRFTFTYFLRGGFLDGREGFEYAWVMMIYESMVKIKMRELSHQESNG